MLDSSTSSSKVSYFLRSRRSGFAPCASNSYYASGSRIKDLRFISLADCRPVYRVGEAIFCGWNVTLYFCGDILIEIGSRAALDSSYLFCTELAGSCCIDQLKDAVSENEIARRNELYIFTYRNANLKATAVMVKSLFCAQYLTWLRGRWHFLHKN